MDSEPAKAMKNIPAKIFRMSHLSQNYVAGRSFFSQLLPIDRFSLPQAGGCLILLWSLESPPSIGKNYVFHRRHASPPHRASCSTVQPACGRCNLHAWLFPCARPFGLIIPLTRRSPCSSDFSFSLCSLSWFASQCRPSRNRFLK